MQVVTYSVMALKKKKSTLVYVEKIMKITLNQKS